jgi:hypothetical protein
MPPAEQALGFGRAEKTPVPGEVSPDRNIGKEPGGQLEARHIDDRIRRHDVEHLVAFKRCIEAEETRACRRIEARIGPQVLGNVLVGDTEPGCRCRTIGNHPMETQARDANAGVAPGEAVGLLLGSSL